MRKVWIGSLVFVLTGCGGGTAAGYFVDTILEQGATTVGTKVQVKCVVKESEGGAELDVPTELRVSPAKGVAVEDHTIVASEPGEYQVACAVSDSDSLDDTPAVLKVLPAEFTRTKALLDPDTIKAGESATLTCLALDQMGNPMEGVELKPDPVEGLKLDDGKVSATKVGQYEVTCSAGGVEGKYEKEPAVLVVEPGDPAKAEIIVDPDQDAYAVGDKVTIDYKVYDQYDNEVPDIAATLHVPQSGMKHTGNDEYEFEAEGVYEVTLTLAEPFQDVDASRVLACDQSGPEIMILFPDRGQTFDGNPQVVVKARVTDVSEIQSVKVNGKDATPNPDGTFEFPITSVHGLNGIVVTAVDVLGHASKVTRGYYYSTAYIPVDADTEVADTVIQEAVMASLRQEAIDDGEHDPTHIDDLATLAEILLQSQDLQGLIGKVPIPPITVPKVVKFTLPIPGVSPGLYGDLVVEPAVESLTLGNPHLSIQCHDGGVKTTVSFSPASLELGLKFTLKASLEAHNPIDGKNYVVPLVDPSASTSTTVTIGTLEATVDIDIEKMPGQDLHVQGKGFKLKLEDIQVDPLTSLKVDLGTVDLFGQTYDLGEYDLSQLVGNVDNLVAQYVIDPVLNQLSAVLTPLLEPLVVNSIGTVIEKALSMLALQETIDIPPVLGDKGTKMDLKSDLSSVQFTQEGARVGLNAGVSTKKGIDRQPLGSILRDGCVHTDPEKQFYQFQSEPSVQGAARNDLSNEVLFMLWWSGMLDQTVDAGKLGQGSGTGGLPVQNIVVTPTFYLPPILDDCNSKHVQQIQVGDLYLDIEFDLLNSHQHLGAWIQARVSGGIVGNGTKIGIKIEKISYLEYELYDIAGSMGDMMGMVDALVPALLTLVEGKEVTFDVPPVDVSQFVPGIPPGTMLQVGNLTSYTDTGVTVIGGDLL